MKNYILRGAWNEEVRVMSLFILIILVGVIWFFLWQNVNKIKQNPDLFPYAVISQDPQGETVFVEGADGSRIRTIVAGEGPTAVVHAIHSSNKKASY